MVWLTQPGTLTEHTAAPVNFHVTDMSVLGDGFDLVPTIDAETPVVEADDLRILRFLGTDGRQALAALKDGAGDYPQWLAMLPGPAEQAAAPGCSLASDALVCGASQINLRTGVAEPIPPLPEASSQAAAPVAPTSVPTSSDAAAPTQRAPAPGTATPGESAQVQPTQPAPSPGAPDGSPSPQPSPDPSTEPTPSPSAPTNAMAKQLTVVGEQATDEVPFKAAPDGTVTSSNDAAVAKFTPGDPVYAVSQSSRRLLFGQELPSGDTYWLLTDGQHLVGVRNTDELWQVDLGDGAAGRNGFPDTPQIAVVGDTVIAANSGGLIGLDLATGKTLWTIDKPFTKWLLAGSRLYLYTGSAVVTADIPAPSAAPAPTPAPTQTDITIPAPKPLPDMAALANAQLPVPPICQYALLFPHDKDMKLQFTGGVSTPSETDTGFSPPPVTIKSIGTVVVDGTPKALVNLGCGRYVDRTFDSFILLDSNLQMLDSWEPWDVYMTSPIQGFETGKDIQDLQFTGNGMHFTKPTSIFGDGLSGIGGHSAIAEVQVSIINGKITPTDVAYHFNGRTFRAPTELQSLQDAFNEISAGNDTDQKVTERVANTEVISNLDQPATDTGLTRRQLYFPPGGKVEACGRASSDGKALMYGLDLTALILEGYIVLNVIAPPEENIQPGDFLCAVSIPGKTLTDGGGSDIFAFKDAPLYLHVTTDESGTPTIVGYGQARPVIP